MTDTPPIIVSGDPTPDQIAAGLRQLALVAGAVAGALGYTQLAGKFSAFLAVVGPLSVVISFIWGQWHTRTSAQDKATLAAAAPNSVGMVR